jgi:hypothetical protein
MMRGREAARRDTRERRESLREECKRDEDTTEERAREHNCEERWRMTIGANCLLRLPLRLPACASHWPTARSLALLLQRRTSTADFTPTFLD